MGKPKDWILLGFISLIIASALVILIVVFTKNPEPYEFGLAIITGLIVPIFVRFIVWVLSRVSEIEESFKKDIKRIDSRIEQQDKKIAKHDGYFESYDKIFAAFEDTRKQIIERFEETMTNIEKRLNVQDTKLGIDDRKRGKK